MCAALRWSSHFQQAANAHNTGYAPSSHHHNNTFPFIYIYQHIYTPQQIYMHCGVQPKRTACTFYLCVEACLGPFQIKKKKCTLPVRSEWALTVENIVICKMKFQKFPDLCFPICPFFLYYSSHYSSCNLSLYKTDIK